MAHHDLDITNWSTYTFKVDLVMDQRVRGLCAMPYPGHKLGCPKYNSGHPSCPPIAPKVFDIYDRESQFFMVINEFNLMSHMQHLAIDHPKWSERQLRCCLYWQSTARKQLFQKVNYVLTVKEFSEYVSTMCPEAMGVNVTETLNRIGVILEWPPVHITRQIALLGRPV